MRVTFSILLLFLAAEAGAQQLVFPEESLWSHIYEGKLLQFNAILRDPTPGAKFNLEGGSAIGMVMDSTGKFSWTPSFDLVDRLTLTKQFSVIFHATLPGGKRVRHPATFTVMHANRPPTAEELPVFYVRQGVANTYQISAVYVSDPDGDPVIFKPRETQMPEGASISSLGQLTWTPSRTQFAALKNHPLTIEVIVQDQPEKLESVCKVMVQQTQLDLPPYMLLVPGDSLLTIRENEVVGFKIYVADPNGEDNIDQVDFICTEPTVSKTSMKANSITQWEFVWMPGYGYVDDVIKKKEVVFTFFAIDKSSNRVQRRIRVTVLDTENVEEKDKILQQKYTQSMTSAYKLINLLDQTNERLEQLYKKARKGKKNRTILNASLGAATGFSPLVLESDASKTVSVIGGTSVLTINSLEAGQVIGKNAAEYQGQLKTNRDLRNQLQLKGNYFARKYALKANRRNTEFELDRDDLARLINSDAVASLALPADVTPTPTGNEIRKTFADYSEE